MAAPTCWQCLGLFYNPSRQTFSIAPKIFEQHVLAVQENLQAANMSYRTQGAAEQHPVKSRKSSSYAAFVPLQKTLHGLPPALVCWRKHIMPESESWSVPYFGCGVSRAA
jgi:hypothetical protein